MPFKKGQSGNPAGRPRGVGEPAKLRKAIAKDIPDVISAIVKRAKDGDPAAAKLLLDRAIPAYKQEAAPVTLSSNPDSLTARATAILDAATAGNLPPDTAAQLIAAVAQMGSTPFPRTVVRRLPPSDPALPLSDACADCRIARCSQTHHSWPRPVSGIYCGRCAHA